MNDTEVKSQLDERHTESVESLKLDSNGDSQRAKLWKKVNGLSRYLTIYFSLIVASVLILFLSVATTDTSGFMGGFKAVGTLLFAGIIISIIDIVIIIFLTKLFINSNIKTDEDNSINKPFVLKVFLVGTLFYLMVLLVRDIFNLLSSGWAQSGTLSYLVYLMPPLFIPISLLLIKSARLNRVTINISFFVLFAASFVGLVASAALGSFVSFILIPSYIDAFMFVLLLPFASISFVKLNINEINNNDKQPSSKITLIAIAVVAALLYGVNLLSNTVGVVPSIVSIGAAPENCVTSYMESGQYLYYSASSSDKCSNNPQASSSEYVKSISRIDLSTKKTGIVVPKAEEIYYYKNDKDNIYFTKTSHGPLYRLNKEGKITKLIDSMNPSIAGFYEGYIFYNDYADNEKSKAINVNTGKIITIKSDIDNSHVVYADKNYIYLINSNENDIYRTDWNFSKTTLLPEEKNELRFQKIENQLVGTKVAFIDKSELYLYDLANMKYASSQPIEIGAFNMKIIGTRGSKVYLYSELLFSNMDGIYYLDSNNPSAKPVKVTSDLVTKSGDYDQIKLDYINIVGSYIYYTNFSDKGNLYRINLDTNVKEKITDIGECKSTVASDEHIYSLCAEDENRKNIYLIEINGFKATKLF